MDPVTGALFSGGLKLLGGLFGSKKKTPTPRENLLSQAQGAREAADKYGFNPLTMLQYGQTSGAMGGGGGAPLASTELLMGALDDFTDAFSGEAAQRAEANRLELELGKIKLEQLRAGGVQARLSAASAVGDGASPLGPRAATVGTSNRAGYTPLSFSTQTDLAPGFDIKTGGINRTSGLMAVNNALTRGDVWMPGDGSEPWGFDEVLTALAVGAPQVVYNWWSDFRPSNPEKKVIEEFKRGETALESGPRDYSTDKGKSPDWWKQQFPF